MEYIKGSERALLAHVPMRLDALAVLLTTFPLLRNPTLPTLRRINRLGPSLGNSFWLYQQGWKKNWRVVFSSMSATLFHFQAGSKPAL